MWLHLARQAAPPADSRSRTSKDPPNAAARRRFAAATSYFPRSIRLTLTSQSQFSRLPRLFALSRHSSFAVRYPTPSKRLRPCAATWWSPHQLLPIVRSSTPSNPAICPTAPRGRPPSSGLRAPPPSTSAARLRDLRPVGSFGTALGVDSEALHFVSEGPCTYLRYLALLVRKTAPRDANVRTPSKLAQTASVRPVPSRWRRRPALPRLLSSFP
mmetsp:Transcript_51809/g.110035  ORF Transcript_51809/g.110035 Transcript_51809/m.110035 type:complete len:214 (+) Transcript_51809:742-1383(+)